MNFNRNLIVEECGLSMLCRANAMVVELQLWSYRWLLSNRIEGLKNVVTDIKSAVTINENVIL